MCGWDEDEGEWEDFEPEEVSHEPEVPEEADDSLGFGEEGTAEFLFYSDEEEEEGRLLNKELEGGKNGDKEEDKR